MMTANVQTFLANIFHFCKTLEIIGAFWEKKAERLAKRVSKDADVNEGKFVSKIDVLYAL
jgi:hypothetical protein